MIAASFEYYPECWFDDSEHNEGWYSLCPPCMEYVIHTRSGGGWVPLGSGEADFPCSRCKVPLS